MSQRWRLIFTPVDTWFFRESRPHGAAGADRLESLFPPPVRTVVGAIRTRIGECLNTDWQAFRRGEASFEGISINKLLGDSRSTGELSFGALQLFCQDQPLYPWPALLLEKKVLKKREEAQTEYVRLIPGKPVECDLGRVQLPELEHVCPGAKVPDNQYLSLSLMQDILKGKKPENNSTGMTRRDGLYLPEPRLGIARNANTGTVEQGMLYQTSHLRLKEDVAVSMELEGLPESVARRLQEDIEASPFIRFGAEGRMARVSIEPVKQTALPECPKVSGNEQGLMLMLLTDADFGDTRNAPLPGFKPVEKENVKLWHGSIHGLDMELHCVMAGKPVRRGGWDLKKGQPGDMKSYVPAGSCYFVKPLNRSLTDLMSLHGKTIGQQTDWGYGLIACGLWKK
ncbi:type III-B CRISPR module-associated Cmr3 family protein [Endozoicomonas euniceicola]|uniref:Type III-B CRISPR module-associated protein Cmr3 n=1 Tax=Endozoicomonas euniceicola TaxID=1234143 RepID=A0ABY6GSI1_9GAMM|nr:type III-B CRISPR module-associated Cmr3 family protein [Endozoicomonas euniceicola]UYM15660.1 hypothetical protein NX720_22970 [Endozoicomonas euniceicola]